jgi:eukaryotic-like serine/threonine-protein kinase
MPTLTGKRLGPYEILAPLGAGGMGEVYRATDTRLDRTVAIKVLQLHLSNNPDLKQRFEREARAISGLSHPNICALYDIGHQDDIDYLVMEFLEGETLDRRLSKGPLSTEQVLRYGIEIANALNKAHRQKIVHRDLKPSNIMMAKSGAKLLDFGLAKLGSELVVQARDGVSALQTEAKELTAAGTILGTLQYMSPEQLEGAEVDERTDIFSFGSVLYEMATGKKAFSGKSQASLISAILKEDPTPISEVQPLSPAALDHVIKKCLAKDPDERWQNVYDVASELKWIGEASSQSIRIPAVKTKKAREKLWMTISAALLMIAIALAYLYSHRPEQTDSPLVRFTIAPPKDSSFEGTIAVSPDGEKNRLCCEFDSMGAAVGFDGCTTAVRNG